MQFFQERSGGGGVPIRERVLTASKVLNFLERLDGRIRCTHEETVALIIIIKDISVTLDP